MSACPYPFSSTSTTRAPARTAMVWEPSVLPLSATTTSPTTPSVQSADWAFVIHAANVSDSLRHGMTIDTSTGVPPVGYSGEALPAMLATVRDVITSVPYIETIRRLGPQDHLLTGVNTCFENLDAFLREAL